MCGWTKAGHPWRVDAALPAQNGGYWAGQMWDREWGGAPLPEALTGGWRRLDRPDGIQRPPSGRLQALQAPGLAQDPLPGEHVGVANYERGVVEASCDVNEGLHACKAS